jgi:hypothetical protein
VSPCNCAGENAGVIFGVATICGVGDAVEATCSTLGVGAGVAVEATCSTLGVGVAPVAGEAKVETGPAVG